MKFLHTMIRIKDIDESLKFFVDGLNLIETKRTENEAGRFTLIFLAARDDHETASKYMAPLIELTYNWDPEEYNSGRNFGHLAYQVDDIYKTCEHLEKQGIDILRPPRDGYMAFIKSPDGISVELLQKGKALEPNPKWKDKKNIGTW